MTILFDFELSGKEPIDAHMTDILLALRAELENDLLPYREKIEAEYVFPFIRFLPGQFGIGYINASPEFQNELVEKVNDKFDFETCIRKIAAKDLN
jgi:hypothetical protein